MLSALDHVVVAVRDLDAATASYERLLGRPPSWRGDHPAHATANTLFRLEPCLQYLVEIIPTDSKGWPLYSKVIGRYSMKSTYDLRRCFKVPFV